MVTKKTGAYLKVFIAILILVVVVAVFFSSFSFSKKVTGKVSFDILKTSYIEGEPITGMLKVNLKQGEHIPVDSMVVVRAGSTTKEFSLATLGPFSSSPGDFYAEDTGLSGSGNGYGLPGKGTVYPKVSFQLRVYSEKASSGGGSSEKTDTNSESLTAQPQEKPSEPEVTETVPNGGTSGGSSGGTSGGGSSGGTSSGGNSGSSSAAAPSSTSNSPAETVSESPQVSSDSGSKSEKSDSAITGKVVSGNSETVSGVVQKDSPFEYNLETGESAELVPGSVSVDGVSIGDSAVSVVFSDGKVVITTSYSEEGQGFGKSFLGDSTETLNIDFSQFDLIAEQGVSTIYVTVSYNGEQLASLTRDISIKKVNSTNVSNTTAEVEPIINVSNSTIVKNSSIGVNVNTSQYGAVLGRPVKWRKQVTLSQPADRVIVSLPDGAQDVQVVRVIKEDSNVASNDVVRVTSGDSPSSPDSVEVTSGGQTSSDSLLKTVSDESGTSAEITGHVTASLVLDKERKSLFNWIRSIITGNAISDSNQTVEVNETVKEVAIEYTTPAPYAIETETADTKEVKIIGPDSVHYENVLAYTELPESLRTSNPASLTVYWKEDNSYLPLEDALDTDNDGLIDYVAWVAPHLSNQTFIIEITHAQHLDENRTFVSDIYDSVKTLDGNWSETISDGHYVRVVFEKNLTSSNDITVYPRTISGDPKIEVYEMDGNQEIAEFSSIDDSTYNRVVLSSLSGSQDSFDLRVVGGSLQFDYIVDPTNFNSCTTLSLAGETYNLTTDISTASGDCVVVTADNIIIEGNGHSITGAKGSGIGINATGRSSLTVRNVSIVNFAKSVSVSSSSTSADAGTLTISDVVGAIVTADGASGSSSASNGGTITLYNSSFTQTISAKGGNVTSGVATPGIGGSVYIHGASLNLSGVSINIASGDGGTPLVDSNVLLINYTNMFSDISARYNATNMQTAFTIMNSSSAKLFYSAISGGFTSVANISSGLRQSNNFTALNISTASALNAAAQITFYGMTGGFTNPQIYRNGAQCGSCTNSTSLNAATVIFTIPGFGNYSVVEGPDPTAISTCGVLNVSGTSYRQTASFAPNVSGACINITAPNIVFNCQGYLLSNSTYTGTVIYTNSTNTTITGCNITASQSSGSAIRLVGAMNSTVSNNTISTTTYGIFLIRSSYNRIANNTLYMDDQSTDLDVNSSYNVLRGNNYSSATYLGLSFAGTNNTVIYNSFTGSTQYGLVVSSNNSLIAHNAISSNGQAGLIFSSAQNNTLNNNTLSSNGYGFDFSAGHDNYVANSTISSSTKDAIHLPDTSSQNNTFIGLTISSTASGYYDFVVAASGTNGNSVLGTGVANYSINASTLTFGSLSTAKITFLQVVNGTGTNLSSDIRAQFNSTYVNVSKTGLNRAANITFYGLSTSYNNPAILRDGLPCPAGLCYNYTSLNAGTVVINVSSWGGVYSIGESIPSCLSVCTEGSSCNVTSSCYLSSDLCSGGVCSFTNFTINGTVYTLYNASLDGKNLTLNISGNLNFISPGAFVLSGQNGSRGGHGGVLNVTVTGLLNRTGSNFTTKGGFSFLNGAGGNGGIIQLAYHGLIGVSSTATTNTSAGTSVNNTSGTEGSITYSKDAVCPLDADVNDDGRIIAQDILLLRNSYNNVTGDSTFNSTYDINCDGKINVIDVSKQGFVWLRGN